jgi:hypothetical protein
MKKAVLSLLFCLGLFAAQVSSPVTPDASAVPATPVSTATVPAPHHKGPIIGWMLNHKGRIAFVLGGFIAWRILFFAKSRPDKATLTEEAKAARWNKIKSGNATVWEIISYIDDFYGLGLRSDVLESTRRHYNEDGERVEIVEKYIKIKGSGPTDYLERKIMENLEKVMKPIFSLCGILWIVNNVWHDAMLPGSK